MSLYWINNVQLYNFLWERGIKPVEERVNAAGYRRTLELSKAIESYEIENYFFKNRR